ncbi:flagellin [Sporosarcina sp. P16b]|uniref:flagellin N-terminal helical domain-containing protein n=1 Tax=Sporosarcina sp. P16b TaxID=2048261 RepID=UPI000C16DE50|nr:flagellin [Sporosarcina sp. P16b]PIC70978.1 flagellin [Sporosarcina sp. P16b]
MIINHNMAAMNTHRQLGSNNAAAANNIEKLSSGLKINRAGDDAAGLAISEKMRGQIRGLDMASKNSQDAISLIQTAEGALNETHDILQRMRELAVQSSNDTNDNDNDRDAIQKEVDQLAKEITRISETTQFNGKVLMAGAYDADPLTFHIGSDKDQNIELNISNMDAATLQVGSGDSKTGTGIDVTSQGAANDAIDVINEAIKTVSKERSNLGSTQNRLEHTINNLNTSSENLTAAESRIRDVDYVLAA